jgi:DNA processing protein
MSNLDNQKYHIGFSKIPGLGSSKFSILNKHFPNVQSAWQAEPANLIQAGLDEKTTNIFVSKRQQINLNKEIDDLQKQNIQVVTLSDPNYPPLLKQIYNPPFILYYKGNLKNLTDLTIAVVGTRKMSSYGKNITTDIVNQLTDNRVITVSGLAMGIDAQAHLTCIQKKQTTVAVLGSSLEADNIYPSINRSLAQDIINNNGIILSEYALGTPPLKHNFPARNRIISGLSKGTLVIEAGERSGALITAQFALEQNREVFAIPGAINYPNAIGTNNLIKKGAKLVTKVEDILEELNIQELIQQKQAQKYLPDSPEEATLLKYLKICPRHVNELVQLSDLSIQEVSSTLTLLEMKGQVKNIGSMTYNII